MGVILAEARFVLASPWKKIEQVLKYLLILSLFLILTGCQNHPPHQGIKAKVIRIVSAQTLEVVIDNQSYTLRLSGLDIPRHQPKIAEEGKQFLRNFFSPLNAARVTIETDLQVKDQYNRLGGYVWYLDRMVNQELLKQGYGIVNLNYTDGKYDRVLINAQDYGRIMEKGIWKIP